jgi:hypothetical protein
VAPIGLAPERRSTAWSRSARIATLLLVPECANALLLGAALHDGLNQRV